MPSRNTPIVTSPPEFFALLRQRMAIPILVRAALFVSLVLAATASNAEIYSCAGPRGMIVYRHK
jgi:hypothetical protein